MRASSIRCTLDLDAEGTHHGYLKLPHSHDESAWGSVMIPVTSVRKGKGPVALLTGANHGDEYEGPIALFELARELSSGDIDGQVIIVPAMNYPAFRAGKRTSPIDRGNLNRLFPGRPDGTITERIADYFTRYLLPRSDYVLDLHSGGRSLDIVPFAAAHVLADKAQEARCVGAMQAFNAPYSMMMLELDAAGLYDTTAEQQGKVFVTTELGGGGTARAATVEVARRGVRNFLIHAGIAHGELAVAPSISLEMPDERCFVVTETAGLVEPVVDLGATVSAGQPLMRVHDITRTGCTPRVAVSRLDGILACRHHPGLAAVGDTLAVVAVQLG